MATDRLVTYKNPPLDEVVLGIIFEPLHEFKVPYIGSFWERVRDQFPKCEQVPVLGSIDEVIDPQFGFPVPRVWLINEADDHLIQIQKNRFHFNWRKRRGLYPRFNKIYERYSENFNTFKNYIDEQNLGDLNTKSYELTYINTIMKGNGWQDLTTVGSLFPDISWRNEPGRIIRDVNTFVWHITFDLPDNYGRIAIKCQTGIRISDQNPLIRLELTASGSNSSNESLDGMQDWFYLAHKWLVQSFEEITSKDVQRGKWGKL